jgi:hypothetical protein
MWGHQRFMSIVKSLNRYSRSSFLSFLLLDVEIFDLIAVFAGGNNVQEFSQTVLFQIFFGQIFQISLWESDIGWYGQFSSISGNGNIVSEVGNFTLDFDSLSKEFNEVAGVENFILNWSWTINGESVTDFLLLGNSFTHGEFL